VWFEPKGISPIPHSVPLYHSPLFMEVAYGRSLMVHPILSLLYLVMSHQFIMAPPSLPSRTSLLNWIATKCKSCFLSWKLFSSSSPAHPPPLFTSIGTSLSPPAFVPVQAYPKYNAFTYLHPFDFQSLILLVVQELLLDDLFNWDIIPYLVWVLYEPFIMSH